MTRKEAIERIKIILEECIEDEDAVSYVTSYDADALDMAIKALKQEPCEDCISRQAAIDALAKFVPYAICDESTESYTNGLTDAYNLILQLPSAQPEPQWIPWNSGNLPEESGTYAVTAYDGAIKRVTYAKYQKRLKRWELTGARAYWRVLAWMPLPEPWRGDSICK